MRSRLVGGFGGDELLTYWCRGCGRRHAVRVRATDTGIGTGGLWSWNGSLSRPTLSPMVRINDVEDPGIGPRCPHIVHEGLISYGREATHALAGMSFEMTWACSTIGG